MSEEKKSIPTPPEKRLRGQVAYLLKKRNQKLKKSGDLYTVANDDGKTLRKLEGEKELKEFYQSIAQGSKS